MVGKEMIEIHNPPVVSISQQEAIDRGMFGPVYHGTFETESIKEQGFRVPIGDAYSGDVRHGYERSDYHGGIPAPIHHLGFGVYFTTVKKIAQVFGEVKETYYLDVPNLEIINFGAPSTMMGWWIKNGYDPELAIIDRVAATQLLTESLSSRFDAVWFKGKGLKRLLDGDQICVYDPSNIYRIESSLGGPLEIGTKVKRISDGMIGTILNREELYDIIQRYPGAYWARDALMEGAEFRLTVRWRKGGADYQVIDNEVEPYVRRKRK
jgi:hypothetical protein